MLHRAGRVVEGRSRAFDGVLSLRGVLLLPQGPEPIDLGMVQVEDRIAGAGEGVPHVSADACENSVSMEGNREGYGSPTKVTCCVQVEVRIVVADFYYRVEGGDVRGV